MATWTSGGGISAAASSAKGLFNSGHSSRVGKFNPVSVPYTSGTLSTSLFGNLVKFGFGNAAYHATRKLGASTESAATLGALAAGIPKSSVPVNPSPKPVNPSPKPVNPSPGPTVGPGDSNQGLEYLYADLAKAYGMDASTAYQEALSNTSYQRAVKDLQAAGLNPVLAAGDLSGAGGVYGATPLTQVAPGIVSSGASSAKGTHDSYKALSNVGALVGTLAGILVGKSPYAAWTGSTVGKTVGGAIGNLLDSVSG